MMKILKNKFLVVLWGMLIPVMTANCSDKKNVEKAGAADDAAKIESVFNVSLPPFQKFVVVTVEESVLLKTADTNSPNLVRWIESDCESDFCENIYQWSDQPGKQGFEMSTDIIANEGRVFPVLGEQGDFFKVSTITKWCGIESAFIPKSDVGDIECAPVKADMLESDDFYLKCRVVNEGKYKDIVLTDESDELQGETLQVGVLNDGVVAIPFAYHFDCYLAKDQKEGIHIGESEGFFTLSYNNSVAVATEEGYESYQLDLKKLSMEQIATIVDAVIKKKPEYVEYMYQFPAKGPETFVYMAK